MKAFNIGPIIASVTFFHFDVEMIASRLIRQAPFEMHYNITKQGTSSLRNLTPTESEYIQLGENEFSITKILAPFLILLHGDSCCLDKAHELILGVNRTNIEKAEYAAMHPGTSWSVDHPLNSDQDMLHALIHRFEGGNTGEGGYTGYENAKYWLAGGGKMLEFVEEDIVKEKMKEYVLERKHLCHLGLVPFEKRIYNIIAGGGRRRDVFVKSGTFDFFRFHSMCEARYGGHNEDIRDWRENWSSSVDELQRAEIEILLKYCMQQN